MEGRGLAHLPARLFLAAVLVFLYVPVAVMVLMAFNESVLYELPVRFTGVWFERLLDNDRLLAASRNSVLLALASTVIATTLGTLAALALTRGRFRGRRLLQLLLLPPIAIPWLIIGTAMLVFFFWTGIGRGLHAMLLGHVALSLPYVVMVVGARLAGQPADLEEAAATLGATPRQAFLRVTLPMVSPGVLAAALFSFVISFDQFVISYFLAPPGVSTLPVEVYSAIRNGFTPEINAVSSVVIAVSPLLMLVTARLYSFGRTRRGGPG